MACGMRLSRMILKSQTLPVLFLFLSLFWLVYVNHQDPLQTSFSTPVFQGQVFSEENLPAKLVVDGKHVMEFNWPATQDFVDFQIPIPGNVRPMFMFRLDPVAQGVGELQLRGLSLRDGYGNVIPITTSEWELLNAFASVNIEDETLVVKRIGRPDYPALLLTKPGPLMTALDDAPRVDVIGVSAAWVMMGTMVLLLWMVCWYYMRSASRFDRIVFASFFVVVLTMRWSAIHFLYDNVPFYDQWSIPWNVFIPFANGDLSWRSLFIVENGTSLLVPGLWSLGLFLANGQWDLNLEMATYAIVLSATSLTLLVSLWDAFGRRRTLVTCLAGMFLLGVPFGAPGNSWFFSMEWLFFVIATLLSTQFLFFRPQYSFFWWLGSVFLLWGVTATSFGFMLVALLLLICCVAMVANVFDCQRCLPIVLLSLTFAGIRLLLIPCYADESLLLQLSNVDFYRHWFTTLAWPWPNYTWLWTLVWLPSVARVFFFVKRRETFSQAQVWMLVLVLLWLLSSFWFSWVTFSPAADGMPNASGMAFFPFLFNGLILLSVFGRKSSRFSTKAWARVLGLAWIIVISTGMSHHLIILQKDVIPQWRSHQRLAQQLMTRYRATPRPALLINAPAQVLPHRDGLTLLSYLRSQRLVQLLPSTVRPGLPIVMRPSPGFDTPGYPAEHPGSLARSERTWGTFNHQNVPGKGRFEAYIDMRTLALRWMEIHLLRGGEGDRFQVMLTCPRSGARWSRNIKVKNDAEWVPLSIKLPTGFESDYVVLNVVDDNPDAWIAVRSPREKRFLSVVFQKLLSNSLVIMMLTLVCIVLQVFFFRTKRE